MLVMPRRLTRIWFALLSISPILIVACFKPQTVRAETLADTPNGFQLVDAVLGIELYQRNYSGGSPDYVQVIHLDQGASVRLLHGDITETGAGQGVYGGNDARFIRKSIGQFWGEAASISPAAFCVSNGQFFKMAESPSRLPFSLKRAGVILTDGYGINEFPGQKLMLELWPDQVDIRELSAEALYSSNAPDIVAGLTENAEKASKKAVGRTFVGVDNRDGRGGAEIILIFNTRTSKPAAAADVLREFGADKVMMLDGGGSTQLVCQGKSIIDTERLIPQSLATYAATSPIYSASFEQGLLPKVTLGDHAEVTVHAENSGSAIWRAGETRLALHLDANQQTYYLDLPGDILPGQAAEISFILPEGLPAGNHTAGMALVQADQEYSYQPGAMSFTYAPVSELESHLAIGGAGVVEDNQEAPTDPDMLSEPQISSLSTNQINQVSSRSAGSPARIELSNIIWVPLVMFPLLGLVVILVMNYQRTLGLYND